MTTVAHPAFGTMEFDTEWGSGYTEVEWAGGVVDVTLLSSLGPAPDAATLDRLARFVTELVAFDRTARAAMCANLAEEESPVRDFVEHHQDELADVAEPEAPEEFVAELRLVRVGLYAGMDGEPAVFNYMTAEEDTQYVMAVKFAEDGTVHEIAMES
jgi:Protein of unknown function (DUF2004)